MGGTIAFANEGRRRSLPVDTVLAFMLGRQWFILYVVVCLEVGIFLTLVPWSPIWERNYFLEAYPSLRPILLAPSVRGAVAGLGLANIYMGLVEVLNRRRMSLAAKGDARGLPGGALDSPASRRDETAERGQEREALAATDDRR